MSFPRYPTYKPSGVEWLGDVPEHWEVKPLKRVAEIQTGLAKGKEVEPGESVDVPFLRVANVQDGFLDLVQVHTIRIPESSLERYLLRSGDVLMNEGGDFDKLGRGCVWDGAINPCIHQNHVFAVRPYSIRPSWLNVYTSSLQANSYFISRSKQSTNLASISSSNLMDLLVPIAPDLETKQILDFLGHETAKIDALIAEQQRLIELLQEKRQAVISHAVTKGLNPDAPMKDSGVEWLGEVPEHWDVTTIKRIVSTPVTDGPHETPEFIDEGIPFVSAEAVSSGRINWERIRGFISEDDQKRYSQKYLPMRNDIFMVKSGATTGVSAIVDTDREFNIWSPLAVIRCGSVVLPRFALHFIRSRNFLEGVTLGWSFGTQQNIGMGVIENLAILVAPHDEQNAIVKQLDSYVNNVDALIVEATKATALLQERRSALISAAVTGQIDVRGLVPEDEAA